MTKAERTRQFIIEKTAPVFNEKGYAGTSLTDLMEATGLTKGSIYGNFENKDEVAVAAFDHNFGQVTAMLRAEMSQYDSPLDKLKVYPRIYRHFLEIPFLQAGCPVLNTATEADDTHPLLRAHAQAAMDYWRSSTERLVQRAIDTGEAKPESDPQVVASLLIALVEGSIVQAKLTRNPMALHHAMDHLEHLIDSLKS